jgi:hypothetical protein
MQALAGGMLALAAFVAPAPASRAAGPRAARRRRSDDGHRGDHEDRSGSNRGRPHRLRDPGEARGEPRPVRHRRPGQDHGDTTTVTGTIDDLSSTTVTVAGLACSSKPLPATGHFSGPQVGDEVTLTCTGGYLVRLASVGAVPH